MKNNNFSVKKKPAGPPQKNLTRYRINKKRPFSPVEIIHEVNEDINSSNTSAFNKSS